MHTLTDTHHPHSSLSPPTTLTPPHILTCVFSTLTRNLLSPHPHLQPHPHPHRTSSPTPHSPTPLTPPTHHPHPPPQGTTLRLVTSPLPLPMVGFSSVFPIRVFICTMLPPVAIIGAPRGSNHLGNVMPHPQPLPTCSPEHSLLVLFSYLCCFSLSLLRLIILPP